MANPFELLGIRPTFKLDPALLEQRQRELNRVLHPDRHAGKTPAERRAALGRAMDVNQAMRRLRDPAARAEALFELLGEDSLSERSVTDPLLLGEMLEQREQLDEIRRSKDVARLKQLGSGMRERELRVVARLGEAFEPLTEALAQGAAGREPRERTLPEVRRLLSELRYVRRFMEEVAAIEDEI